MSTKYSSLLINTFLIASRQIDDDMFRASALSNLGQLCTVLRYSLSKDLSEVIDQNFFLSIQFIDDVSFQIDFSCIKKLFICIRIFRCSTCINSCL